MRGVPPDEAGGHTPASIAFQVKQKGYECTAAHS